MLVQIDDELEFYRHHTAEWEARVNVAAAQLEKEVGETSDRIEAKEDP
jgi:hypothetical protein